MICPSKDEFAAALAAARPRGDAWRNGGSDDLAGSVMGQFFNALADPMAATSRRLCALIEEFFCSTAVETLDVWAREVGLPDACDPFADVCEKVNRVGDTTPDYVIARAAVRGWAITIAQDFITATGSGLFGASQFGDAMFGAAQGVKWTVSISLAESPAYAGAFRVGPFFGAMMFGQSLDCPPDTSALECLVRLIAPAHVDLAFVAVV